MREVDSTEASPEAPKTGPRIKLRTTLRPQLRLWLGETMRPLPLLAALTVLYVASAVVTGRRYVWFDELFTRRIALAPSIPEMWRMIRSYDFNPPAGYLLSRISMALFGANRWGLRLPSVVEFYLASMALFEYVRRKVGAPYAAFAVLTLWSSPSFRYATEARPYALLLMSGCFLLVGWDRAVSEQGSGGVERRAALTLVAISSAGLFAAHIFGIFSLLPFVLAELVRWARRRRPDYPLWAGLLLPSILIASYWPMLHSYRRILFPPAFQASLLRLASFFYLSRGLALASLGALLVTLWRPRKSGAGSIAPEDAVLFAGFLLSPLLLMLLLIHQKSAFWDRYFIATQAALCAGAAIFIGLRFRSNRIAGYTLAIAMMAVTLHHDVLRPFRQIRRNNERAILHIRPDLPLVDASMLTFFEMNRYESPAFLSRLYFLTDRQAAIQYAHATAFENFLANPRSAADFPLAGRVEPYAEFVSQHREFLVFGAKDYPEDWLLPKLAASGARIETLGDFPAIYRDKTLFLVTMPPA